MSSLIILPGSTPKDTPLVDRVMMLDTNKAPKFQCFGFFVSRNSPIAIVTRDAQEGPIRTALEDGRLMDITGTRTEASGGFSKMFNELDHAVKSKSMSPVQVGEEIGPRVIIGKDSNGNSYFITPKDEADYQRMQEEIRTTGTLRVEKPKHTTPSSIPFGLSAIFEEEIATLNSSGE